MSGGRWRLAHTRDRLLRRISAVEDGCWTWKGSVNSNGYGLTSYRGRRGTPAHRAVYMEMVGPIADGMTLDHLCHNRDKHCPGGSTCRHRRCVSPDHLEAVPLSLNQERARIGRIPKRKSRPLKTHCPAMHEYTPANTRVYGSRRFCIACQRAKDIARSSHRKAT